MKDQQWPPSAWKSRLTGFTHRNQYLPINGHPHLFENQNEPSTASLQSLISRPKKVSLLASSTQGKTSDEL
jgi:hypothetical protein